MLTPPYLCVIFASGKGADDKGWVYLTTIWYQTYKEESPIQNVLHVLPAPIMGIFVCLLVPYLAPRVRAPIILCIGGFCTA